MTQKYYIDEKVLNLLNLGLGEHSITYEEFMKDLYSLSMLGMSAFLESKGYAKELIEKFVDQYNEAMAEQDLQKSEELLNQIDPVILSLIKSTECQTEVISNQSTYNQRLYDLARPNLSQAQKDELNRYLDSVEADMKFEVQEMKKMISQYDDLLKKIDEEEAPGDAVKQGEQTQPQADQPAMPQSEQPSQAPEQPQPVIPATPSAEESSAVTPSVPTDSATSPAEEPPAVAQAEVAPVSPTAEEAPIAPAAPATPSQPAGSTTPPAQVNTDNPGVVKPIDTFPAQ